MQRELNVVKYPGQIPSRKAFKFLVFEDPIDRHYRGLNKGKPVDGAPSERKATIQDENVNFDIGKPSIKKKCQK